MKLKKTLAVLSAIAAGSTMIFGQAVNAQAEELVPTEEITAPVEEFVAPVENVTEPVEEVIAPVQEVAAPVEETVAPVVEVAAPIEEAAAVTTAIYEEIAPETTVTVVGEEIIVAEEVKDSLGATQTAVAASVAETTTTTTVPYLDTAIYNPVDVNSASGKAQLADKNIDYNKIYNDFLNDVIVPNTEGGISAVTESGKAQETYISDMTSKEERVYSEMFGVFAATVHDFCNDGIPEFITVTNTREKEPEYAYDESNIISRLVYDIWQYDSADDAFHKILTQKSVRPLHATASGIFETGKQELSVSLAGDTILEEYTVDSRGDASINHSYTMYQVGDDYSFKAPYQITTYGSKVDGYKYGVEGGTVNEGRGYIDYNTAVEFKNAESVKAAFKSHGVDADVAAFASESDKDVKVSNVKDKTPLLDYTITPQKDGMHYNLKDYTGVHGKASSAAPKTEAKKDAKKTDSPKTGVAFPIAAAGTGAAAVAFAVLTTLSKKKKD